MLYGLSDRQKKIIASGVKKCSCCKKIKSIDEYYMRNDKRIKKSFFYARCKSCSKNDNRNLIKRKSSKLNLIQDDYYDTHSKKCKKCGKTKKFKYYYIDVRFKDGVRNTCKKCEIKIVGHHQKKNRSNLRVYMQSYRKKYYSLPENKKKRTGYQKKRGKLTNNMTQGIRRSLKGDKNGLHWENVVGYNLHDLKAHLELLFKPGMNWNNYGKNGWEIDHVRPVSAFNIVSHDCQDFKECWSLSNLQPLWAVDNQRKGKKWD